MSKLSIPIDSQVFIATVESLDRSKRPEYIFEYLCRVIGGEGNVLIQYAVEAKEYWESRCCSMLVFTTPAELYEAALQGKLPKVNKREKETLLRLAWALCDESRLSNYSVSDETAVTNCHVAEAILKHIHHKYGLLRLYLDYPQALRKRATPHEISEEICRKALTLAQELNAKEEEMQALNNIGRLNEIRRDFERALDYYLRAYDLLGCIINENDIVDTPNSIPQEYVMPKAILLYAIGNCKGILGDTHSTISLCTQAIAYVHRFENTEISIHLHQLLARAYGVLSEHHNALQHLIIAGETAERIKSPFLIGQTKMFVAVTYSKLGDFPKAIEYGLQATSAYKLHESVTEYLIVCGRVGTMMVSGGEFDRAQAFFAEVLTAIENADQSINLNAQKSLIFRQLARIAICRNQWEQALIYLQFPLEVIDDEYNLPHLVMETLVIAADGYIGAQMYDQAAQFAQRTLRIATTVGDPHNQFLAHQQLSIIAENLNDIDTAFHHYKEFHRIKEQVYNDESDQRNKNMIILLEENEAHRTVQAERLRRYELEEEIGQLSMSLVHLDQTFKEIQTTLRTTKPTNEHAEQVVQVLRSVVQASESALTMNSSKSYKLIDEQIEAKFPNLPRVKRELCRFIALGYSTKEIARLMGISVESVHTLRYRTRTQFGLKDSDSLDRAIKLALSN